MRLSLFLRRHVDRNLVGFLRLRLGGCFRRFLCRGSLRRGFFRCRFRLSFGLGFRLGDVDKAFLLTVEAAAERMGYSYDAGKRLSAKAMRMARAVWQADHAAV